MTTTNWRRLEKAEDHLEMSDGEPPLVIQIVFVPWKDGKPDGPPIEGERIVIGGANGGGKSHPPSVM
jgi:hypothetical protein